MLEGGSQTGPAEFVALSLQLLVCMMKHNPMMNPETVRTHGRTKCTRRVWGLVTARDKDSKLELAISSWPLLAIPNMRPTLGLHSSSCLGLPYRIHNMNHKKELLWSL